MLQLCFQSALFSMICKLLKQIAERFEDIHYEEKNKPILLPVATLGRDSRPSRRFRGAIQAASVSIIRHSRNRSEPLFLSEGSFSINIPLMQPQALNNCWLLKSFCACPNRSAPVEYQLHSHWLKLQKTKRVNKGVGYKGKISQCSQTPEPNEIKWYSGRLREQKMY